MIQSAAKSATTQQELVEDAANRAWYGGHQNYNVIVCNLNSGCLDQKLEGVAFYTSFNYNGDVFGVWMFDHGEFRIWGDGGYRNWYMIGWFYRYNDGPDGWGNNDGEHVGNGKNVHFSSPPTH